MAEKQLNAWVVLGGKVDNSFQQLGNSLVNLGGSIDGISQKLINFGKQSVNTYRGYEDSMLEAQVALSTTYGRGTTELNNVMSELDRAASNWAATTIFHTDDVASAIAEAAHANWDLDKILTGMPAAMRLAQAGSLDLSTGLDYIIKSTNAAGISFSDLENWVDEWTYAANSSAGDVEQFGEAMLKMGNTMKFADNKEELLTMLAVLHDSGTVGSSAGTLLRNTMIRLIAPTKKASDVMEELGVAQGDLDEALGETDGNLDEAIKMLEEVGFSAYDSKGNLKDMTTIFEDLFKATGNMTDQDKLGKIWSALFPTRTITGAMALIEAAGKNWNGLLDDLNGGKATGYGKYAADTMMSGLTGAIETFNSKVEDLRKELGQQLAPQLQNVADNFGKVVDMIRKGGENNGVSSGLDWLSGISDIIGSLAEGMEGLDPAVFDALVSGLGVIAGLGPTLMVGGLAIRGIGNAMALFTGNAVGRVILAAAGLSVIMTALNKYNEAKWLENFGSLNIDTTQLDASMTRIQEAFNKAKEPTQQYADALRAAIDNYEEAGQKFSATMMEDLLADQTLTGEKLEEKLGQYRKLGSDMVGALKDGITSSADMSAEFWAMVIKGQNGTDEELAKNELYGGILKALDDEKGEAMKRAESIGNDLQAAINKAWEDGHLDEGEREKIKQYFKELNEAMAEAEREAQEQADYVKRRQMMDKAQGLSYQQMDEYIKNTIEPQRQEELDWYDQHFNAEIYAMEFERNKTLEKYNELMSQGRFQEAAEYRQKLDRYDQNIAGAKEYGDAYRAGIYSNYDQMIMSRYAATMADSTLFGEEKDASTNGMAILQQAADWFTSGMETNPHILLDYIRHNQGGNYSELQEYYQQELAALGGVDEIKKRIAEYNKSGDKELQGMADSLETLLALYSILNPDSRYYEGEQRELTAGEYESMYRNGLFGDAASNYLRMLLDPDYDSLALTERHDAMEAVTSGYLDAMAEAFGEAYNVDLINALLGNRDLELDPRLRDDFALAQLLGMTPEQREQFRMGGAASNYYNALQEYAAEKSAFDAAYSAGADQIRYLESMGRTGEAQEIAWDLAEKKAQLNIKEQAMEEARAAYEATQGVFDEPLQETVETDGVEEAQLTRTEIETIFKDPIQGRVLLSWAFGGLDIPQKAKGGRETEPSIFAEAGVPEWYIPEEHTDNTAKLLIAAAANSGFSLVELAAKSGAQLFAEGGTDGGGSMTAGLAWGSLGGGDSGDEVSSGGISITYSPTIHANDASGVGKELEMDKERLKKYFEEFMEKKKMYESIAGY